MDVATLADLLREAEEHHGPYEATAPKHHWSGWYAAYISARAGEHSGGGIRRCRAVHGACPLTLFPDNYARGARDRGHLAGLSRTDGISRPGHGEGM
jgi:hypothetical protein